MIDSAEIVMGNARIEDDKIVVSFLCADGFTFLMTLEPDFAEAFGVALLHVSEPSLPVRLWRVLTKRSDDE